MNFKTAKRNTLVFLIREKQDNSASINVNSVSIDLSVFVIEMLSESFVYPLLASNRFIIEKLTLQFQKNDRSPDLLLHLETLDVTLHSCLSLYLSPSAFLHLPFTSRESKDGTANPGSCMLSVLPTRVELHYCSRGKYQSKKLPCCQKKEGIL